MEENVSGLATEIIALLIVSVKGLCFSQYSTVHSECAANMASRRHRSISLLITCQLIEITNTVSLVISSLGQIVSYYPVRCLPLHWYNGSEWYLSAEGIEKFNIRVPAALDNRFNTVFSQVFFKALSSVKILEIQ